MTATPDMLWEVERIDPRRVTWTEEDGEMTAWVEYPATHPFAEMMRSLKGPIYLYCKHPIDRIAVAPEFGFVCECGQYFEEFEDLP